MDCISDVCSSDLADDANVVAVRQHLAQPAEEFAAEACQLLDLGRQRRVQAATEVEDLHLLVAALALRYLQRRLDAGELLAQRRDLGVEHVDGAAGLGGDPLLLGQCFLGRSEEHTSELQSLMRISYAVFCLKKTTTHTHNYPTIT